jgi:hypothetical protein
LLVYDNGMMVTCGCSVFDLIPPRTSVHAA